MAEKKEKGLFKKLIAGRPHDEEKESVFDPPEETGFHEPPVVREEPSLSEMTTFVIGEGALLTVWRRWKENTSPPIQFMTGPGGRSLPLSESAINQERVRLKARMEQEAKKRLKLIEQAEAQEGGRSLNASCSTFISRDGMVAWVFVFPPYGEEGEFVIDAIGRAMQESGITTGIESTVVTKLFTDKQYYQLVPVALGTPPKEGIPGELIEHYPRKLENEVKLDENGMADYRSLNYVQIIQKGDVICDIVPPIQGEPGVRVDGKVVEPKRLSPVSVPRGTNTELTEDGGQLIAARDGHLEFAVNKYQVKPVLEIPADVDYSTGNIDFLGDVHIRGDVREAFSVKATGTITIDGLVECANVEAGGDLIIARGVQGDNRALIKSRGSIRAKYLESCVVYAGQCVFADCVMSSQIYSDDSVDITSGRGTVIGGAITAARQIKAKVMGSQSGRQTHVTLGILPYVQEELRNSEEDLQLIRREGEELDKQIAYFEERQGMEGSSEKLAKAHLRKSVLAMKEDKIIKRRKKLEPMAQDLTQCRFECGVVYPITFLAIGDSKRRIDTVSMKFTAAYDTEERDIKIV